MPAVARGAVFPMDLVEFFKSSNNSNSGGSNSCRTTIGMNHDELHAALKAKTAEQRFVAAYVVGEKRLNWPKDLIPLHGRK